MQAAMFRHYRPFVLLANVIFLGHVDQVDHRLGGDEQVLVQLFNLLAGDTHTCISSSTNRSQ